MKSKEQWTSKIGFILASTGSAIGLGAIWKFPNVVATSGGGAFLLLFLLFTLAIGLPLLIAEFVIGRNTGKGAHGAYKAIAPGSCWHWVGYLGMGTCFLLLSFYSVVGGWILLYWAQSLIGGLLAEGRNYNDLFKQTTSDPWASIGAQFSFMLITIIVVSRGIQKGIERVNRVLMPGLFSLFLVLIVRSLTLPGMTKGLTYFLLPDFSKLTGKAILDALGQSFFCLSVGVSVMVTYSSYLNKKESLMKSAASIVSLNVLTSLMAGIAIFPALFALGMRPQEGPGLLFNTLPALFEHLPYGGVFITLFLALFLFAALTSAFSMLEIMVSGFCDDNCADRKRLSVLFGLFIFVAGVPSALSFSIWSKVHIFGLSFFDMADFMVTNILMPIGVLFIALFVGYRYPKERLRGELSTEALWCQTGIGLYLSLLRYVIPIVIMLVFLNSFHIL